MLSDVGRVTASTTGATEPHRVFTRTGNTETARRHRSAWSRRIRRGSPSITARSATACRAVLTCTGREVHRDRGVLPISTAFATITCTPRHRVPEAFSTSTGVAGFDDQSDAERKLARGRPQPGSSLRGPARIRRAAELVWKLYEKTTTWSTVLFRPKARRVKTLRKRDRCDLV